MKDKHIKICVIGAGSPYTPEIIERLAQMQEALPVTEISLMDIDETRLDIMHGFCSRYAAGLGFKVKITKTIDRKQAIIGSAFVLTQIRVGGNAARVKDERIPMSMGLVGQETTGAGGFAKALRTIPVMLDIAKDVQELAPNAWIINYTNPTGLITEALTGKVKIAGLCAGGLFPRNWTAEALGINPKDVYYNFAGLNHMNFAYDITINGRPITGKEFSAAADKFDSVDKELILKLGALPSPYLQYYFHKGKKLLKSEKTRGEEVMILEKEIFHDFSTSSSKPESLKKRGGGGYSEVACDIMDAIFNNRDAWAVVNAPNKGILPFLPNDAVIEVPCIVNASGITPIAQNSPPKAVWGLISAVKNYEMLTVEAATTGCNDTALLALVAHPLIGDYDLAVPLLEKILEVLNGN